MKKRILQLGAILCLSALAFAGYAQTQDDDKKKNCKKVEKRIEISDEDGEKTIKVTTIEDGKKTVKSYTGEEADKYLEENQSFSYSSCGKNGNMSTMMIHIDDDQEDGEISDEEIQKRVEEAMKEMETKMEGLNLDSLGENMKIITQSFGDISFGEGDSSMMKIMINGADFSGNIEEILKEMNIDLVGENGNMIIKKFDISSGNSFNTLSEGDVNFYPNESTGKYHVNFRTADSEKTTVVVKDDNGKEIFEKTVSDKGEYNLETDLDTSKKGEFTISMKSKSNEQTKKIVIK